MNRHVGVANGCQIRQDLADDAGKLKPMARESSGTADACVIWVPSDDKVPVDRHRIETRIVRRTVAADAREMLVEHPCHAVLLGCIDAAINLEWIVQRTPARVFCDLHAASVYAGKAVEETVGRIKCEARKMACVVRRVPGGLWLVPKERLAEHLKGYVWQLQEVGCPGAWGEYELIGCVGVAIGRDDHAAAVLR